MRWLTIFYAIRFKWTATAAIGIHSTKARLSQLVNFKNTIWYFRRTICKKILFETWKKCCHRNVWNTSDCSGPCFMNQASDFERHKRFKEGRESVRDDERCGRSEKVRTQELIGQRVLGLELLCWGCKGVQEEIPSEDPGSLQIESVAFLPGQGTRPQLHPCNGLFDQDGNQDSSSASL